MVGKDLRLAGKKERFGMKLNICFYWPADQINIE